MQFNKLWFVMGIIANTVPLLAEKLYLCTLKISHYFFIKT